MVLTETACDEVVGGVLPLIHASSVWWGRYTCASQGRAPSRHSPPRLDFRGCLSEIACVFRQWVAGEMAEGASTQALPSTT